MSTDTAARPTATSPSPARRIATSVGYCVTLVPRAVASIARPDPRVLAARRPLHLLLGLVFGAIGLVVAGLMALFVARGALYGVVDDGPYADSWGGPTLAGAWAVHFAVALAALVPTVALGCGVAGLHRRATAWARGSTLPSWFPPVAVLACAVVASFMTAFVRQL